MGYRDSLKQHCLELYLNGTGFRAIERVTGVNHNTVIQRLVNPGMGFGSFNTQGRTLRGDEAMNMIRQGQVQAVALGDIRSQLEFLSQIFAVVA